jgi:hypothetical protein
MTFIYHWCVRASYPSLHAAYLCSVNTLHDMLHERVTRMCDKNVLQEHENKHKNEGKNVNEKGQPHIWTRPQTRKWTFFALRFLCFLSFRFLNLLFHFEAKQAEQHQSPRFRFKAKIISLQFCFNRKQTAHPKKNK